LSGDLRLVDAFTLREIEMLSAYVDGELLPTSHAAIEAILARDPRAAAQVAAWCAQKAALKALLDVPCHAAPPVLLRPRRPWWWQMGGAMCGVVAGVGLAAMLGPLVPYAPHRQDDAESAALARRADIAYAVYSPERRHPVEVAASEEPHLVDWLSKRLGRKLSVPSLQEYGYSLVGGRLLPGGAGPAAQFMYENHSRVRLTLYVTRMKQDEVAFRLLRDGDRRTVYWVSDRMGYALSGAISEAALREITSHVCGDLSGNP
jgi:anti-sigma factor RsiW